MWGIGEFSNPPDVVKVWDHGRAAAADARGEDVVKVWDMDARLPRMNPRIRESTNLRGFANPRITAGRCQDTSGNNSGKEWHTLNPKTLLKLMP